ncbi:AbiEi antitoxin N-terminal domain-containing protein [Dawidia cretensis]|nr:AbiEi antitoxin N-terminal domain-containing protein [Dawidia cretensis]
MEQGFNRVDIDNLVKSGVLTSLRHGVYVRGQFLPHWHAIVYSLQAIMDEKPVVGGLTALEIRGFAQQVQLLVRVLPLIDTERCFALKGGTAINLSTDLCHVYR